MSKSIIIDFSGWLRIEAKDLTFVALKNGLADYINGEKWLSLDEKTKSKYIIHDIIDAQQKAYDGVYENIDIVDIVDTVEA
jgi:hypothetical protein